MARWSLITDSPAAKIKLFRAPSGTVLIPPVKL
jgi:hypothetical protein